MVGERGPARREAENAHRKPPDRARHPVAIEVERRQSGARISAAASIAMPSMTAWKSSRSQIEAGGRRRREAASRAGSRCRRRARSISARQPSSSRRRCRAVRPSVRDVVDGAAEGVDGEHRLALLPRQHAHGRDRTSFRRRAGRRACDSCRRGRRHRAPRDKPAAQSPDARRARQAATQAPSAISAKPALPDGPARSTDRGFRARARVAASRGSPRSPAEADVARCGRKTARRLQQALGAPVRSRSAARRAGLARSAAQRLDGCAVRGEAVEREVDAIEAR